MAHHVERDGYFPLRRGCGDGGQPVGEAGGDCVQELERVASLLCGDDVRRADADHVPRQRTEQMDSLARNCRRQQTRPQENSAAQFAILLILDLCPIHSESW